MNKEKPSLKYIRLGAFMLLAPLYVVIHKFRPHCFPLRMPGLSLELGEVTLASQLSSLTLVVALAPYILIIFLCPLSLLVYMLLQGGCDDSAQHTMILWVSQLYDIKEKSICNP